MFLRCELQATDIAAIQTIASFRSNRSVPIKEFSICQFDNYSIRAYEMIYFKLQMAIYHTISLAKALSRNH